MTRDLAVGYALLTAAIWLWAGNAVVARTAMLADVPPFAFNFWRWGVALLILLPFTAGRVWRHRALVRGRWRYFAGFGLVSVAMFNSFYYVGLQTTTAVQGALIMAILPVLVLIIVASLFAHRITPRQLGGAALSIAGAAVIVVRGDPAILRALAVNTGDLWCLAAVTVWAVQIVMLRWKPAEIEIAPFMAVIVAFGVAFQAPLYLFEHVSGDVFRPDRATLLLIGYVALFAAVIGTTMYNAGVIRVGPANAGYFANLYPAFAAFLAVVFLGEPFEWFHGAGGALVLAGIYLATFAQRQPAAEPAP